MASEEAFGERNTRLPLGAIQARLAFLPIVRPVPRSRTHLRLATIQANPRDHLSCRSSIQHCCHFLIHVSVPPTQAGSQITGHVVYISDIPLFFDPIILQTFPLRPQVHLHRTSLRLEHLSLSPRTINNNSRSAERSEGAPLLPRKMWHVTAVCSARNGKGDSQILSDAPTDPNCRAAHAQSAKRQKEHGSLRTPCPRRNGKDR